MVFVKRVDKSFEPGLHHALNRHILSYLPRFSKRRKAASTYDKFMSSARKFPEILTSRKVNNFYKFPQRVSSGEACFSVSSAA